MTAANYSATDMKRQIRQTFSEVCHLAGMVEARQYRIVLCRIVLYCMKNFRGLRSLHFNQYLNISSAVSNIEDTRCEQ